MYTNPFKIYSERIHLAILALSFFFSFTLSNTFVLFYFHSFHVPYAYISLIDSVRQTTRRGVTIQEARSYRSMARDPSGHSFTQQLPAGEIRRLPGLPR